MTLTNAHVIIVANFSPFISTFVSYQLSHHFPYQLLHQLHISFLPAPHQLFTSSPAIFVFASLSSSYLHSHQLSHPLSRLNLWSIPASLPARSSSRYYLHTSSPTSFLEPFSLPSYLLHISSPTSSPILEIHFQEYSKLEKSR